MAASEKKKIILRAVLTAFTGALVCWIFSNSLKDAESSSSQSGAVLRAIQNFFDVLFPGGGVVISSHFVRKAAHFSEYALLGAMLFFTYRSYTVKWNAFFIPLLLAAAVPFLDEGLQFFSEGRAPRLTDVGIDLSGALFGMLFAWAVLCVAAVVTRKRKRKTTRDSLQARDAREAENERDFEAAENESIKSDDSEEVRK